MSGRAWDKATAGTRMRRQCVESYSAADVPIGLPTKMEAPQGASSIETAARWFAANRQQLRDERRHPVPELRDRFALSSKEAIAAIVRANEMEGSK